ncbi:MAG: SDR family oxidoreductase [Xanthomonadales bacterium]|nr:SDR family oxidoreductase [Xanthomonadales bacterium]
MNLENAHVLLTGASGGLGSATARALIARGAVPILSGRNQRRLQQLADSLASAGQRPEILVADWSQDAGRQALITRVQQTNNPVSGVILNAGINHFGSFEEQSAEQLQQTLLTDLVAPALLAHGMLPALKGREGSCLLFVGSTFGRLGHPGFAAYASAKHGLHGLAKALRRESAGSGLRIAEVHPRAMHTEMTTPDIAAVNRAQGASVDSPESIAAQLVRSLETGRNHWQAGWPERLFVLLDQRLPGLLDRVLGGRWPALRQAAYEARSAPSAAHPSPTL